MADQRVKRTIGPYALRTEAGQLLTPADVGARIENMYPTEEGTLRSVSGPTPYLPGIAQDAPSVPYAYPGRMHGIFHCLINGGERELLLVQSADQILEFRGWLRDWRVLLGPSSASPYKTTFMVDSERPEWPAQFEATPSGVVIVPQNGRAWFYDGDEILPLGFAQVPSPPVPLGPSPSKNLEETSGASTIPGLNDKGYAHDAQLNTSTGMYPNVYGGTSAYGVCKIGTIERFPGATLDTASATKDAAAGSSGILLQGQYRYAVQWIDRWGNLSAISGRSAPVAFQQQRARQQDSPSAPTTWSSARVDFVLKQIGVSGIEQGPEGTIGRILLRTKDEMHAGTAQLFEISPNAAEGGTFATLPDNISTIYPDNTPDAFLFRTPQNPVPVGRFRLCRMWDGRMWIANFDDDPGRVHPSLPGRWGTYIDGMQMYPDPQGRGITGMWRSSAGLLVFSETTTFLVTRAVDSYNGYRTNTLSATVGCIAPSSIDTLPDGRVVWLARGGVYTFDGSNVEPIHAEIDYLLKRLNLARALMACAATDPVTGEYRCWIPIDGSRTNNLCIVYDGRGWRRRTDVKAAAVCVVQDHRKYMLVAGQHTDSGATTRHGVWVLDNEVFSYAPETYTSMVETSWISAATSKEKKTATAVYLWLVEQSSGSLTVEVMKNWRQTPVIETIDSSSSSQPPKLHSTSDIPPFWNNETYGAAKTAQTNVDDQRDNTYRRRRPLWRRVQIGLSGVETYKLRVKHTGRWEFIGISVDEVPKELGGGRIEP